MANPIVRMAHHYYSHNICTVYPSFNLVEIDIISLIVSGRGGLFPLVKQIVLQFPFLT